jgi:hypothetical protein
MPFCSKCGTQNQDNANVCVSCGNNLGPMLNLTNSSNDGFLGSIKNFIDKLLKFFDSGDFFRISWRWLAYYFQIAVYVMLPAALIVAAIKFNLFDLGTKFVITFLIAFIFLSVASFLSAMLVINRSKDYDETTKNFSMQKVTLSNFYDFFKVALVHYIETYVYALGVFIAIMVFGLAVCSLFIEIPNIGTIALAGFIAGPVYAYINIFITKIIVLFLKVFLEYLPKLFIIPIRALYNLFGIIIDTRHNLWKKES